MVAEERGVASSSCQTLVTETAMSLLSSSSTHGSSSRLLYPTAEVDIIARSEGSLGKKSTVDVNEEEVVESEPGQDLSLESASGTVPSAGSYRMYPQRFVGLVGLVRGLRSS